MTKVATVIGARPQFIKCAPVTKKLQPFFEEIVIHTGQHYDKNMSDIFFEQLEIPKPQYNLNVGSGTHAEQTAYMLTGIERILLSEKPEAVIVYGDTNSTLAGAIAASKLCIPVFHIEAGLRSYNRSMPEEQNRIVTDVLSTILFCPTKTAKDNLLKEGNQGSIYLVGDVMFDSVLEQLPRAEKGSTIIQDLSLRSNEFILATIHRAENTDSQDRLRGIIGALNSAGTKVVMPLHPRTKRIIEKYNINLNENICMIDPVGYLDMLVLQKHALKIITDSGGIQKEAFFLNTPCIVTRNETEWTELIEIGANILTGTDKVKIADAIMNFNGIKDTGELSLYGDGNSASKICEHIRSYFHSRS